MLADWISIDIPWWAIVLGFFGLVFWPLTIAAAITGLAAWRIPALAVRIVFGVALVLWLTSAFVNLMSIGSTIVDNIRIHNRHYTPGAIGDTTLLADTAIDGILCSRAGVVHTDFLGKLDQCTLARPQLVRGVPCTGLVNFTNGVQCVLSSDFPRFGYVWRAATQVRDSGDGTIWFQIGANAPSMTVLGSPLLPDSEVTYQEGKLLSITFVDHPLHYGSCTFDQIIGDDGRLEAQCDGNQRATLPATALRARQDGP
ncbi:MAG TPA: hypothetical protein VGG89_13810 [Candidatus Baltobacteraceae bacterium]